MQKSIYSYGIAVALFTLALLIRVIFLPFPLFSSEPFQSDAAHVVAFDGYYDIAENLRAGRGFSQSRELPYEPDSVRTPLYPLFIYGLTEVFDSYKGFFIVQMLLGAATALVAWRIAARFLDTLGSVVVGFFFAIEPLAAYLTGVIMTETLFAALFLWAVLLLLKFFDDAKTVSLIVASILLGLATLVKPTIQYLPAFLLVIFLYHEGMGRMFFKHSAITVGIFLLILSPWMYRNFETFGTTQLVVQPVSNMYTYLIPSAIALERGLTYEAAVTEFFARERVTSIGEINLANAPEYRTRALNELKKHPRGFLMSAGVTIVAFFTNDGYASILARRGIPISFAHPSIVTLLRQPTDAIRFLADSMKKPEGLVLMGRFLWVVVALLSAIGVFLFFLRFGLTSQLLLVVGTVAYFAATTIVIGLAVNGRFRVPVDPIIFIFAVYALQTIFQKRPHGNKPIAQSNFLSFRD